MIILGHRIYRNYDGIELEKCDTAGGIDVHKKPLVCTIVTNEWIEHETFQKTSEGLLDMRNWFLSYNCYNIVMESTGIYWKSVYDILEKDCKPVVVNAYQTKAIPGRKTDQIDSEWLAELHKNGLTKPSYVPPKEVWTLRQLNRYRIRLVSDRTRYKNRIHRIFDCVNFRLSTVFSDMFGAASKTIMQSILEGKSIGEILSIYKDHKWIQKKAKLLKEVCKEIPLTEEDIYLLKSNLAMIKALDSQICILERKIKTLSREYNNKAMDILESTIGVGPTSAAVILAELGDVYKKYTANQLASFAGLVPKVHQSAGKTKMGGISKQGSRTLRWVMTEVAHCAAKVKNSRLRSFYYRIRSKKGPKVAVVALARKLLTIIHHLLSKEEFYEEEGVKPKVKKKSTQKRRRKSKKESDHSKETFNIESMIYTLSSTAQFLKAEHTSAS